jgi:hypothetical protein
MYKDHEYGEATDSVKWREVPAALGDLDGIT